MSDQGDRDEALSTFIAVTGAEYATAREQLELNRWDLQRAINTHLEVSHAAQINPPAALNAAAAAATTAPNVQHSARQQSSVAAGLHGGHVIDCDDDLMDEISLIRRRENQSQVAGSGMEAPPAAQQAAPAAASLHVQGHGAGGGGGGLGTGPATGTGSQATLQPRTSANEVIDVDLEDANQRSNNNNNNRQQNTNEAIVVDAVDTDRNYIEEQMLKQALEESLQTVNQQHEQPHTGVVNQQLPGTSMLHRTNQHPPQQQQQQQHGLFQQLSGANTFEQGGGGGGDEVMQPMDMGPSSSTVHGQAAPSAVAAAMSARGTASASGAAAMSASITGSGAGAGKGKQRAGVGAVQSDFGGGTNLTQDESPNASHNLQRSNSYSSNAGSQDKNMVDVVHSAPPAGNVAPHGNVAPAEDEIILPEGVNAEEAKMLEAAMFGIPYQGPIPTAGNAGSYKEAISSSSMTPEMRAQRQLRIEQEREFRASLKADQEKDAARQRHEAEKRRKIQEESDRVKVEAQRMQEMKQTLEAALATEPSEPVEEIVNVMIRLPDGTRLSRRFLRKDPVKILFHFVDYLLITEKEASDMKPGTYKLLTQFPRKVIVDTDANTLEDVGLSNKQEALFVEKCT
mmetsp:Transcript_22885/g.48397  ORF Transcript_22885/g.48397 Transcript_22885/m.48397 type:complete len:625 (-) Transcript_22885:1731-3605(-)